MRKLLAVMFALAFAVATVSRPALADHPGEGGAPFRANLIGASEFPGPGHPTATGTASFRLNPGQEEICYEIETTGLAGSGLTITGAHIHNAPAGSAAGVLVPLKTPTTGASSGCTHADREVIKAIMKNPENYYINVHAQPGFGPGAIRGQLEGPGNS